MGGRGASSGGSSGSGSIGGSVTLSKKIVIISMV